MSFVFINEAWAATITVNTDISGVGCTLIDAIDSANANAATGGCQLTTTGSFGDDTIILPPGNDIQTLISVNNTSFGPNGLPAITSRMTIRGGSSFPALIRREPNISPQFRLFLVSGEDAALTLENVRITGGDIDERGGGVFLLSGSLVLNGSVVAQNKADTGAGINNQNGVLTIRQSAIIDNEAFKVGSGSGGGIYNHAVADDASLYIIDSTISGNEARGGAGIAINGAQTTTTIINTTISDNFATSGGAGGISASATSTGLQLSVRNSIIADNRTANTFGGSASELQLELFGDETTAETVIEYSLIGHAGITTSAAVNGINILPTNNNIFATSDGDTPTTIGNIIMPLVDRNGASPIHALTTASPAINAATDGYLSFPLLFWQPGCQERLLFGGVQIFYRQDQRGLDRPQGSSCDIGSYEKEAVGDFYVIPMPNGSTVIINL